MSQEGNTPLHYAALSENPEVITFLLRKDGRDHVLAGSRRRWGRRWGTLLESRNDACETPLLRAAFGGSVTVARALVVRPIRRVSCCMLRCMMSAAHFPGLSFLVYTRSEVSIDAIRDRPCWLLIPSDDVRSDARQAKKSKSKRAREGIVAYLLLYSSEESHANDFSMHGRRYSGLDLRLFQDFGA